MSRAHITSRMWFKKSWAENRVLVEMALIFALYVAAAAVIFALKPYLQHVL